MSSNDGNWTAQQDAPPVILSCASADLTTVEEAADALRSRGHGVDVVSGVEDDDELLGAAIRGHDRQGLYVLCRSQALPRKRIDKLRIVLRSNEVPFGRTLTLAIEAGQARALEERVVSVARRMITGRPESVRPPARPLPTPVASRVYGAPPGTEDDEIDTRVESSDAKPIEAVIPEGTPVPVGADEIARWADSLVGEPAADHDELEPSQSELPLDALVADADIEDDEVTQRNPKSDEDEDDGGSGYEIEPPEYSGAHPAAADAADLGGNTVRSPMPEPNSAPGIGFSEGGGGDGLSNAGAFTGGGRLGASLGSRGALLIGIGGAVLLVLIAIVVLSVGDDQDDADDAIARSDDAEKTDDAAAEPKADEAASKDEKTAKESDEAEARPDPDPEAETPEPQEETKPADEEPQPEETAAAEPMVVEEGPPDAEDSPQVLAALRNRDVRAIDTLLVAEDSSKATTFAGATGYCKALSVGGLAGWRVPTIGELWTVGDAKIVRRHLFWSDTVGDVHGERRLVYNAARSRIGSVPETWDGARTVCVRARS